MSDETLLRKLKRDFVVRKVAEMERELDALVQQRDELLSKADPGELLTRIAETSGPEGVVPVAKGMVDDLVDEVGALHQDMMRVARDHGHIVIGGRIRRNPKPPPSRRSR